MMNNVNIPLLSVLVVMLISLCAFNTQAQNQTGDLYGGLNVGYGFEVEEPSIGANGFYSITDEIRAGAEFIWFFTDSGIDDVDFNVYEFNVNGHYIFQDEDGLKLYGLAGINHITFSWDTPNNQTGFRVASSFSETGLNIGGGVEYDAGGFFLFGEPKFTLSDADQFSINVGARMQF